MSANASEVADEKPEADLRAAGEKTELSAELSKQTEGCVRYYIWQGHGLGYVMDCVPYGCGMGQSKPLQKMQIGVPFAVLELQDTAVGAEGARKLYGLVAEPCRGWVDLTSTRCEECTDRQQNQESTS